MNSERSNRGTSRTTTYMRVRKKSHFLVIFAESNDLGQIALVKPFLQADEGVKRERPVDVVDAVEKHGAVFDGDEVERVAIGGEEERHAVDDAANHRLVVGLDVDHAFLARPKDGEDVRLVARKIVLQTTTFVFLVFVRQREDCLLLRTALGERGGEDVRARARCRSWGR